MKRITFLIVAACIVFGACLTGCGGKRDPKMYIVSYRTGGTWNVEVLMNGIPVIREVSGSSGFLDVNYYMVDGSNTLTVKAEQADKMFVKPLTIQVMWLRNSQLGEGRFDEAETLFEIVVEPKETGYSIEESRTFEAEIPARWTWLSAEVIEELTQKDREEIFAIINRMYDAWKEKDVDKLASFSEIKIKDYVEFFGDSTLAEDKSTFEKYIDNPLYSPKLRSEKEIEMETFGKVVIVRGKPEDNEEVGSSEWIIHLLHEKTGEKTWMNYYVDELKFSRFNGVWKLIDSR